MSSNIALEINQNNFAKNSKLTFVDKQEVIFQGRKVQKFTYVSTEGLLGKIGQLAIAALLTLVTLGLILCSLKGRQLWVKALNNFKDRIYVYIPTPAPFPLSMQGPITAPPIATMPATIVPAILPPSAPAQLCPADLLLQLKRECILKENPEYGNAMQAWEKAGVSLTDQVARLEDLRQYAFGTDKWVKYFGEIVGVVPPLPDNIVDICNSNDHSKPGERVKDTHVLVLVPEAIRVNGKQTDITLKSLGELLKAPKGGGHSSQYRFFDAKGYENTPVAKSHWALMKKEIIPDSRKQIFARQVEMVKEYSKKANVEYCVPHAIDAAACCFMNFVSSGNRLFDMKGPIGLTFTRCQEQVEEKYPLVVGGFAPGGLDINHYHYSYVSDSFGIGAVRKF